MKIIDQHTKKIMEDCKVRARDAGLCFDNESLEYIVTNQDLIELSPKGMIPTLYDYWVNDVETLKGKGQYKLYPHNPYETVINSRPAISYYNDNNPDWLNIMIFYHVIGHIDFFQNNILFEHTWSDDFVGKALADKRHIAQLRSQHGRWVDYIIEFSRSIDNLTGYFTELSIRNFPQNMEPTDKLRYYFDEFLPKETLANIGKIYSEIERYNILLESNDMVAESMFFSDIKSKHPEFESKFQKYKDIRKERSIDIMDFIRDNSPFLKRDENQWMKAVINIVRDTSLYFAPQIRTKTINEGWASYWHDELFRKDDRIKGHESEYSVINAKVTSISRVGYNPYAIGLRLVQYIESLADAGKISREYQLILNSERRDEFNKISGKGKEALFNLRSQFSDFMLINTYVDQDFVDLHKLFVVGERLNQQRGTVEYYVKSKKAEDYKRMLIDNMYHPPFITIDTEKSNDKKLFLKHHFEGKQLYKPYINDTLLGIEYLWFGNIAQGEVILETTDIIKRKGSEDSVSFEYKPIHYIISNKKVSKRYL
ncbi:MAG: SpoVR family protein [Candidatus Kapabacteria bacterium]|nr:SpoVR family protein [Ignavibacteriota bacterium]MCW5886429.1 SpoVR family protein [Candidatus Kapabacteria bacterium]